MSDKLDYSNFSEMEMNVLKAIATNHASKADIEPLFPAFERALTALGVQIEQADDVFISELLQLSKEIAVMNKYLLKLSPPLPSKDPEIIAKMMSNDEIIQSLLKQGMINYFVGQLGELGDKALNRALEVANNNGEEGQWIN